MIQPDDIFLYLGGKALTQTGTPVWRTRPRYKGGEDLRETISVDTDSYARQRVSRKYVNQVSGTSPRVEWWDLDADDVSETPVIVIEDARTNVALQSSNLADSSSPWAGNGDFTIASATSIITGQTAYRHTNDGGSAARVRSDTEGTCTGNDESIWCILEQDTANAAVTSAVDFGSDSNLVSRATLTWSTGAVAVTDNEGTGRAHVVKLADTGPNGGAVYLFGVTAAGTVSEARTFELYPTGIDQNTKGVYVHHIQHEEAAYASMTPIVTAGSSVARGVDTMTVPWQGPIASFQFYCKFIEYGGILESAAAVMNAGLAAGPRFYHYNGGSGYVWSYNDGSAVVTTGNPSASPTYGDEVETLCTVSAAGVLTASQSINGAAAVSLSASAAPTLPTAWGNQTLYLSGSSAGVDGGHGHIAMIGTRGTTYTLAEYRELSEA